MNNVFKGTAKTLMENSDRKKTHGLEAKTVAQKWSNNVNVLATDLKKQVISL